MLIQEITLKLIILSQSGCLQSGIDTSTKESNVGMDPITVAEIREAVRRFYANNSPVSMFCKTRSPICSRLFAA